MAAIFQGTAPSGQDADLLETTDEAPEGFEYAPGLTPKLMELVVAAAEMATPRATETETDDRMPSQAEEPAEKKESINARRPKIVSGLVAIGPLL